MKRFLALFAVFALLAGFWAAAEEDREAYEEDWEAYEYEWEDTLSCLDLRQVQVTRSTLGVPRGTVFDVYSAPFDDAWRAAGGKARVSADEPFTLLGTAEIGAWSMIEYRVSGGAKRIGWARLPNIDPGYGDEFPADDARRCTLTRDAALTDDPRGHAKAVMKKRAGETVTALGLMDEWAYVQTEADGKTAWLFIPADALSLEPCWTVDEDGVLRVSEGITRVGGSTLGDFEFDDWDYLFVKTPLRKDEWAAPALIRAESVPVGVRAIEMPSTLRSLGSEAVFGGEYDFIRLTNLPDGASWDAFYSVRIGRLILSKDCLSLGDALEGDYLTVEAWEVEEGNPVYSAKDGVLFSADGKKLISYPNGAKAEHYTVPAGVEEIGDHAFRDDALNIPLKTVSLPIGLKKIGDSAFADCGRLISLAVPLTVTELSENAFSHCVSLERLSLPPGLTAVYSGDWAERGDFSRYNGDNGPTDLYDPLDESGLSGSIHARLDTPDGLGTVPWYVSPYAAEPSGETPAGTEVYLDGTKNCRAVDRSWDSETCSVTEAWYSVENLLPMTGDSLFTWKDYGGAFRTRTGDSRVLGLLQAEEETSPIRLLDAPGGREQMHLYPEEQAEVLESRDGWLRVYTAYGEGWIPEGNFKEITQAAR